jgi:hypothetical protein
MEHLKAIDLDQQIISALMSAFLTKNYQIVSYFARTINQTCGLHLFDGERGFA